MMSWLMVAVLLLVTPGCPGGQPLDKTGTSQCQCRSATTCAKTPKKQEPAGAGSLGAERGGFEPPVRFPVHSISSAAQSAALSPLRVI